MFTAYDDSYLIVPVHFKGFSLSACNSSDAYQSNVPDRSSCSYHVCCLSLGLNKYMQKLNISGPSN